MQDDAVCNAGSGSNLTEDGTVEGDASIMAGDGTYAAVGAAVGVTNPIRVAERLAAESHIPMPLGRVRPLYALPPGILELLCWHALYQ